ncbi:hypothetical protein C942_00695 [Photobacterium marinum]|uniref:Uncharacterized protein n=1 Tax=Photobacterium marinum TaxID=1056511 RepID=L8JDX3_9GAMM|nr:hypothetical protein C942_00695 [Photobacterium marinum]
MSSTSLKEVKNSGMKVVSNDEGEATPCRSRVDGDGIGAFGHTVNVI